VVFVANFSGENIVNVRNELAWRVEGPFDSTYSLALLNREIALALQECGARVALFSTEGPGDFAPAQAFLASNPELARMNKLANRINHSAASVVSRNIYPPRVRDMQGKVNMLHSYAWEETGFPIPWVSDFNSHLQGVACISRHVHKIMRDNGVYVPATVTGCGVDHWERVKASDECKLDLMDLRSFRFLHVSSFFPRKGPEALLEAWAKAFSEDDDVCLIIKTFPNPHNNLDERLDTLRATYPSCAPIHVVTDDMTDPDLKALYQRCHVLVAPSYAEGFCLPIAEAMLSGIPCITTSWSGQLDFCTTDNSWLVDYCFEQAETHFGLVPSAWAAVDIDELATAMKAAYRSSSEQRSAMAYRGRELLLSKFKWNNVAKRLIDFYHRIQSDSDEAFLRVGWVSTWNTKCGIATYSANLLAFLKLPSFVLAARADQLIASDAECVSRCWNSGDDDLNELSVVIDEQGLNALVIQWNFGFFSADHLWHFLDEQKQAGRVIIIEMHATADPPQSPHKTLASYIDALAIADRVLVHTIADMNILKSHGLVDNVALFPHGIMDFLGSTSEPLPDPTIATFGFCLPHKGLQEVVEAVALLRDRGTKVNLKMVNAEYPIEESRLLIKTLQERVRSLDLCDQINIYTDYLEDTEIHNILSSVDLLLFVYHPTSESASGAARYGLSVRKPIMVTDLPIFSEFRDMVWRIEDNEPSALAKKIIEVITQVRSNSLEHRRKQEALQNWCEQHGYKQLSSRLSGMIKGLRCDLNSSM
jgi:glycosyltransferase involved in cell wall biosynthesis